MPFLMFRNALLVLFTVAAADSHAACVTSEAQFQAALTGAQGATTATEIRVAQGMYSVPAASLNFASVAAGQGALAISGGWDGTCTTQTLNASLTVLDGQNVAHGVLNIFSHGNVSVRFLTIENGNSTSGSAGSLSVLGAATIAVDHNILHGSTGSLYGGLVVNATAEADVDNNLIYANTATGATGTEAAGAAVQCAGGPIYATNNTIADNILTSPGAGSTGGLRLLTGPATLSNNIGWGNTTADLDYHVISGGTETLVDSDYGVLAGTPGGSGNLSVDPRFLGAGDYHLATTSPLLGKGTITPAGGLPTVDLEGTARTYANKVDLGAYERDEIFANGFEP